MRRWLILLGLSLALGCGAYADTLKLLDGKVVTGTFLGGDARTIRMEVNNKIEMFPISEVESLSFGGGMMGSPPPDKIDPKKAKEEEKARKKAEEQAAKAAKEAEKAQQAAAKAAAKAEEAAAKAKGATAAVKAPAQPKVGRFGKPAGLGKASDAANAAKSAPAPVSDAAQTAGKVANTANQAVTTANQAKSVAADPAAAAAGAAQQAAVGAVSNAAGAAAPVVSNARVAASTTESVRSAAQTASKSGTASGSGEGRASATPSSTGSSSSSEAAPAVDRQTSAATPGAISPLPASTVTPLAVASTPSAPAAETPLERDQTVSAIVPTGVVFRVRMVEAINTEIHRPGEVFRASLEGPLVSGGVPVPKGADVMLRIVKLAPARGSSTPLLSLEAISLRVDFRNLPFAAELMTQPGDALRGSSGAAGTQVFHGAAAIHIPSNGLVSLRTTRLADKH